MARSRASAPSAPWDHPRLAGKTVALAGQVSRWDRERFDELLEWEGATLVDDVTEKLDFLVVGKVAGKSTLAQKKADKLQQEGKASIQVRTLDDFRKMLELKGPLAEAIFRAGEPGAERWQAAYRAGLRLDVRGGNLRGADLRKFYLWNVTLEGADLREGNLEGAWNLEVSGARLDGAKLAGASIKAAKGARMRKVDLSEGRLWSAEIEGADLTDAILRQARMESVIANEAIFVRANLSCADLEKARLSKADLTGADLSKADLREADLSQAKLTRARLLDADLSKANLREADLSRADLREARMSSAKLRGARLEKADLTGAIARHAILCGANLTGATLVDTILDRAEFDEQTIWPARFTPPFEMTWRGKTADPRHAPTKARPVTTAAAAASLTLDEFKKRLPGVVDPQRLANALQMLRAEKFELFTQVEDDRLVGVIRSQSSADRVYACKLTSEGDFSCGTQNLRVCGGLGGAICKHLLVLIVGLASSGKVDLGRTYQWIQSSRTRHPLFDKEEAAAVFLRYKGAEAGEIDWRPTETIPEDYHAY